MYSSKELLFFDSFSSSSLSTGSIIFSSSSVFVAYFPAKTLTNGESNFFKLFSISDLEVLGLPISGLISQYPSDCNFSVSYTHLDVYKRQVIDYLEGNKSRIQICGELCISSRTIQDWALIYNKHGLAGFSKKMRNGSYSKEFKMKVVEEYVRGDGSSIDLGIKYDISSGLLRKWIRMYNANRELKDYNPKQEVYMAEARRKTTLEERKEIVDYCINHNRNYKNTAAKFDVSYSQVYSWVKKYDTDGADGLTDRRGCHKTDAEVDELERLKRENLRLKRQLEEKDMVVELLKKVKEFEGM